MIIELTSFFIENGIAHVEAVLEDARLLYSQTLWSPQEYGPGLCYTSFDVDEAETIPIHQPDLVQYLESMCLTWELVPSDALI
jgi:hypothetical protein